MLGQKSSTIFNTRARNQSHESCAVDLRGWLVCLKTADVEFRGIRDALKQYRSRVREEIRTQPEIVLIDRDSLTLFVRQSEVVRTVDEEVAAVMW